MLFRRLFVILVVLLILVGNQTIGAFSQEEIPFEVVTVSDENWPVSQYTRINYPKLSSSLSQMLYINETDGAAAVQEFCNVRNLKLVDGRVQVVIVGRREADMEGVRSMVTFLDGQLESAYENFQQAMVPISALETLTDRSDIEYIREPWRPVLLEPDVGLLTTEGVAASNANNWHSNPIGTNRDGTGVSVAIIDGGFFDYTALLGSDLPGSVSTQDYTGSFPGTSPHGTACAEIVHDMAPGASMYLVLIGSDVDLANAITYLISEGVDVISMSLGWIEGAPGDGTDGGGTSPLYAALANARSNGIFVSTAAGNNRDDMWSGTYSDHSSAAGTHQWPHGGNVNCIGPGSPDFSCYIIPILYTISASLHWDSWPNGPDDYDLLLVADTGSGWSIEASSIEDQTAGAAPIESISYNTLFTGSDAQYGFVVVRNSASGDNCFRLILSHSLGGALDEQEQSRTLIFPADSPNAMSVAAVDVSTFNQESYSSEGPIFGFGGVCTGGTIEPDISGFANVSTVSYDPDLFNGTSAATPHVAGAAALFIEAYQATIGGGTPPTPAQTQDYLETNATNIGSPGKDNQTGFGYLTMGGLGPTAVNLQDFGAQSGRTLTLILFAGIFVLIIGISLLLYRKRAV